MSNLGEALAVVELALELAPAGGAPLARGTWRGLLPAGERRALDARVDWSRGALVLAGASFAFEREAPAPGASCVARARLRADTQPEQVLEVGLRAPAGAGRP